MALKISEIPTALSEITNETLVEVSEKSGETYTTKKFDLKKIIDDIAVSPPHGDEAHTEDYIKEGDSRLTNARMPLEHAQTHVDGTDDIQLATSTQKGLMSSAYAAKLDGIEANANNYIHPATHSLDMITETSTLKIMTADERYKLATMGGIPI